MKINQKLISGFLVVSLLIIVVGYVGIIIQERLTTHLQETAGEVLPGTVAFIQMDAELYHVLLHATEYASTGDIKTKKHVEAMLADLIKHMTVHKLYHAQHDDPSHIKIIEEKIDSFINIVTEYILLKDKGGTEEELGIVKEKIERMLEGFTHSIEPVIEQHLEKARETIKTTKQDIAHARKLILGSNAIILILVLVVGYFISRLISKPIIKLTEAANEIGKGKLDTRIEIKSRDEIGELADSFNKMTKDLQAITVSRDAFAQEVDERKRAEEALRENTRKTQIAYEQSIIYAQQLNAEISERKQAEEEKEKLQTQFIQAQKMEAIGTLAGGIAHDFNNLLMGIQGNASLMLLRANTGHPHYERLKNIEQYVQSGAGLAKQLLGLSRSGKYEVKPIDLNEFIENTSGMFGRTKKEIRIHRKYQKDIWTVEVDHGQIEQALLNLYVNAWQAMPGGGDLYLQTANVTLDESYVKPFDVKPGKYVKISVTDTGVGMDEKTMARIFEPFFTTKEMGRGTGLGLASAYGIIKNHGGIINAYSEEGKGTTFNICLPASEKAVAKEKDLLEEVLEGTETILLVDDEDMIVEVGKEMLRSMGYKVLVARGGKEAVEVYGKNKKEIDLVILDMIMPDMGGSKAYDRLKEINSKAKVLLSSGYSINDQAGEILERGCNGFIQKPFDMKQLFQKIRDILDNE